MARETSSSGSSKSTSTSVSQKDLLKFYQKKYEEFQGKEDKYKDKVDRHLKNLATDRLELEEEVLRQGEKIADLQKALVELQLSIFEERERFLRVSSENEELKKNEERLHDSIRQLLAMTHQQDLRDKIIYILKNPKVDVGYRTDISTKSRSSHEVTANQKLKEELDHLKHQLDEVLKVSKHKSDIVLEDCKEALERSKTKIMQDEVRIKELQKMLKELEAFERNKSSIAAAKNSSIDRQRSVFVDKCISAERQISPTTDFQDIFVPIKSSSLERQRSIPVSKSLSSERQSSATSAKGISYDMFTSSAATKSASAERPGLLNTANKTSCKTLNSAIPASKSLSSERQSSATSAKNISYDIFASSAATKSASAERPVLLSTANKSSCKTLNSAIKNISKDRQKPAKSISWENQSSVPTAKSISGRNPTDAQNSTDLGFLSQLCSRLKDTHLTLILLMKVVSRVKDILNSVQATKLYHRTALIPKALTDLQYEVEESTVLQLETCLRQCTRLTFDINNMYKSLDKYVTLHKAEIYNSRLSSEVNYLEKLVRKMVRLTADNDLLNVDLRRSDFFQALRDSSVVISEENRVNYLRDFKNIIQNNETLSQVVFECTDFVERVIENYTVKRDFYDIAESLRGYSYLSSETRNPSLKQTQSESLQDLENLVGIYKRTVQDSENLGLPTEKLSERIKAAEKILQDEELNKCEDNCDKGTVQPDMCDPSECEDVIRKINKTLSKVEWMEQGRYLKDEEMCRKLAENIDALTEQFKELNHEYNVKNVQQQFSEYSKVTLSKLEELAKQCRNSVIAAETQIAAHRSNAKKLSKKLKETEDLLCESINECLSLKQKMKQAEAEQEMEKYTMISTLKEKLATQDVEEVIDEIVSDFPAFETIKSTPFVCMYCRHGPGHKYCEEKIKDLTAECRKFKTQLKLLKHETDQERLTLKNHREIADSSIADLTKRNQSMEEAIKALQKKNTSLLEQLKLGKNRMKDMERFRRLEIQGFQTDIKLLKDKIKDLEKQLLKAILIFENNHKDIEVLKTVHETAHRSQKATAMLKQLKAKLYQLGNDIKSL